MMSHPSVAAQQRKHAHYFRNVEHLKEIDIYRFLELFNVTDQALGHAIKKLVAPGGRGAGKDFRKDVQEAIDTLQRRLDMLNEDEARATTSGLVGAISGASIGSGTTTVQAPFNAAQMVVGEGGAGCSGGSQKHASVIGVSHWVFRGQSESPPMFTPGTRIEYVRKDGSSGGGPWERVDWGLPGREDFVTKYRVVG